jgi:hypothetical protein
LTPAVQHDDDALRLNSTGAPEVLRNVCAAYLDFARSQPVVYEAMFVFPTKIKFASEETPTALRAAFAELVTALGQIGRSRNLTAAGPFVHDMFI